MAARQVLFRSGGSARLVLPSARRILRRAMTAASTGPSAGPVLTFLSPGPAQSRSAVAFLHELFRLPRIETATSVRDGLDQLHFGASSSSWDSTACACPASGTILHFLSLSANENKVAANDDEGKTAEGSEPPPLRLIAVHGSHSSSSPSEEGCRDALAECRRRLARSAGERQLFPSSTLEGRLRGLLLRATGGPPNPSFLLEKNPVASRPAAPLFDLTPLPPRDRDAVPFERHDDAGKLRELALPFFPGASSLQETLSASSLSRPLPGLYQCSAGTEGNERANPGLILRPLPAAGEDMRLSPPSLVFQCECLDEAHGLVEEKLGGAVEKIGWRGHGRGGSLIARHPSIAGLDVRINNQWEPEGMFAEAQASLMAGSLDDLQSVHVASEGKVAGEEESPVEEDPRTLHGDCWVETRANVRNPAGFFKRLASGGPSRTMVAKPPNLPFE